MEIQTPIVQAASSFHGQILETFAKIAMNRMHDLKYLDAANTLFGDLFVSLFLLLSKVFAFRLFHLLV